jgi:predicted heme/steroid binding protein
MRNRRQLQSIAILTAAIISLLACASGANAREEYSLRTRRACVYCHYEVKGGGDLRPAGYIFRAAGYTTGTAGNEPPVYYQPIRLLAGVIHIVTAIIWFGVIFYVHLIIKPDNLRQGLPKSEVKLGWTCIALLAATGAVLSLYRFHALNEIRTTTFGVIWCVKIFFFLLMVSVAAFATTRLNKKLKQAAARAADIDAKSKSMIIYEGFEYDVSESKLWKGGMHMRRHYAGSDLTGAMAEAPHGPEVLERLKKTGPAHIPDSPKSNRPAKMFKFLTYGNLFLMAVIILCIALWNWGPPLLFLYR